MCELVAEHLIVIWLESDRVVDDIEVSRVHCALGDILRYEIEIEPLGSRHHRIDNRAAFGVLQILVIQRKEARIATLFHYYKRQQWLVVGLD